MFDYQNFRKLRKEKNIRLNQISESIGRSTRTIINWEKGASEPNEATIKLLADAISAPVSKISDLKDQPSAILSSSLDKNLPRAEQNIVEFLKMTDNQKLKSILELRRRFEVLEWESKQLIKEKNFHNKLINTVDICISIKDIGLRYTYVNDYFLKYFGIKDKSLVIGKRNSEIFTDRAFCAEIDSAERGTLDSGDYVDNKLICVPLLSDMKRLGIMNICRLSDDEYDKVTGIMNWIADITDVESTRKQLSYVESALDNVNEVIQIFSLAGNVKHTIYVNNAVTKIYAVEKSVFYEDPNAEIKFVHKDDRKSYDEFIKNKATAFIYRISRTDKEIRNLSHRKYYLYINEELLEFSTIEDVTQELRTKEDSLLFSNALNNTSDTGFYIADTLERPNLSKKNFRFLSDGIETIFGYKKEKFLRHDQEFKKKIIDPEFHYLVEDEYWKGKKYPHIFEYKISTPLGKEKWLLEKMFFCNDNYMYGIIQDITKFKKAEFHRILMEKGLNLAPSTALYIIKVLPDKTRKVYDMIYISDGVERIYERSKKDFYNFTKNLHREILHPDFKYIAEDQYWNELKYPHSYEYKIVTPSGKEKWIHEILYMGKDNLTYGIMSDITDKKESKKTIEKLIRSINEMNDAFCLFSCKPLKMIFTNKAREKLYGYTVVDMIQGDGLEVWYKNSLLPEYHEQERKYNENRSWPPVREFKIRRPDGSIRYIEARFAKFKFEEEEFYSFIDIDITKFKESQAIIEMIRKTLNNVPNVGFSVLRGPKYDRHTFISDGLLQIFGLTRDEPFIDNPRTRLKLIHPDDLHYFDMDYYKNPDKYPSEFIYRIRRRDGIQRKIYLKRYFDMESVLFSIHHDITSDDENISLLVDRNEIAQKMFDEGIDPKVILEITKINLPSER